jgi:hypothetical protein
MANEPHLKAANLELSTTLALKGFNAELSKNNLEFKGFNAELSKNNLEFRGLLLEWEPRYVFFKGFNLIFYDEIIKTNFR